MFVNCILDTRDILVWGIKKSYKYSTLKLQLQLNIQESISIRSKLETCEPKLKRNRSESKLLYHPKSIHFVSRFTLLYLHASSRYLLVNPEHESTQSQLKLIMISGQSKRIGSATFHEAIILNSPSTDPQYLLIIFLFVLVFGLNIYYCLIACGVLEAAGPTSGYYVGTSEKRARKDFLHSASPRNTLKISIRKTIKQTFSFLFYFFRNPRSFLMMFSDWF